MKMYSTITSKRQLTIPARVFRAAAWKEGQKVIVSYQHGALVIKPAADLVEKLSGSVSIPGQFRSMNIDEMIRRAKKDHFHRV